MEQEDPEVFNQIDLKNDKEQYAELYVQKNAATSEYVEDTALQLKRIIQKNLIGCDFMLCLFAAALKSYTVDKCLRPFPQYFINNKSEKDFALLRNTCDTLPPLKDCLTLTKYSCSKEGFHLLTWLFVEKFYPILIPCSVEDVPSLKFDDSAPVPNYVFEVSYSPKSEEIWQNRIKSREVFYAYHGSGIDNFYSIIHSGLQQHFNDYKLKLYGNGIYLSSDVSVCANYAPFRETWKNSMLGTKHSVMAVCQVINDIEKVKCKDATNKKRALNANSLGEIPEKYFVVTDSDMVKVKYLLVYRHKVSESFQSVFFKNLFWIILIFYFLILVLIGFMNGPYYHKIMNYFKHLIV